ncbi:metal-sulfur cluster assembly factor [Paenibacillus sp. M1]|uniref:Metal-sulfur cluster assembly factor n=1 Tax=Paenibacillus haidiansis TaxID=1574488 RepID=A0ABU7VT61_9BACL
MDRIEQIRELLREVYDPELGVNIVDLGLVFDIREEGDLVYIQMTLTTPGCPMHDTIVGGVERILQEEMGYKDVEVDLVWEPRWSPYMMSEEAKKELGYF